jgi:dimeric dUTPase (all-alpha-NTP-PPase superfamily)
MAGWLANARAIQTTCFDGDPSLLPPGKRLEFIRNMVLGLIVEITEALAEVQDWKWWVADRGAFDRDKYLEELVDVSLFLGALAVAVDCTDEEWQGHYLSKIEVVRQRAAKRQQEAQ